MSRLFSDVVLGTALIWAEGRGEPQSGRVAIGEIVRNRTLLHYMSDGTIPGTIFRPYQFSCLNTRDPNRSAMFRLDDTDPIVQECRAAWLESQLPASQITNGAVFYMNPKTVFALSGKMPDWVELCDEVAVIGRHHFYRLKGG